MRKQEETAYSKGQNMHSIRVDSAEYAVLISKNKDRKWEITTLWGSCMLDGTQYNRASLALNQLETLSEIEAKNDQQANL